MSRYVPDELADVDQPAAAFEDKIRNFIQREAVFPDRQRGENPVSVDSPTDLNVLVQRVTAASWSKSTGSFLNCKVFATCCAAKTNVCTGTFAAMPL